MREIARGEGGVWVKGSPFKGPLSREKSYFVARNGSFLVEPFRYPQPYHCRSFIRFRCQSSLHQSPIRIKVIGEALYPLTLSAFWRTRKSSVPCRVQKFVQVLWLLTSPKMARGMGSKDADNDIKGWDGLPIRSRGFTNPKAGSPSQPAY